LEDRRDRRRKLESTHINAHGRASGEPVGKTEGAVLKGSQAAEGNSAEIFDGSVNGDAVSWKVSITNPMPMTLEFAGTVQGNNISGTVVLGAFGSSSFSGTRG